MLRVPGFIHQKKKPFRSRIIELNTSSHSPYSPNELVRGFGLTGLNGDSAGTKQDPREATAEPLALKSGKIKEGEGRDPILTSEVGRLWKAGYTRKLCRLAAHQFSQDMFDPPMTDDEVKKVVESVTSRYPQGVWKAKNASPAPIVIETSNFLTLQETEMEPIKWIAPDLIPPGLNIFVAKPKIGKSSMAFNICLDVAAGRPVLGHFPCEPSDTLYLALEDSPRGLKERLAVLDRRVWPQTISERPLPL